jgi:5-methylcytosine-specific restriction endonuclease McrA
MCHSTMQSFRNHLRSDLYFWFLVFTTSSHSFMLLCVRVCVCVRKRLQFYQPLGYLPLSLWSWQDAVKAIFKGSVTVVDVYPDLTVRASNIKVPLPSVIALNDYVPQKLTKPAFTRRNVFLRDEYRCQYCNNRFHTADLSLDHVVPRSMGGPLTWENAVTCCKKCNCQKGSTPLSEIRHKGMKLNRQPRCPTQMELAAISGRMVPKRVHPTWKPYLGIQERPAAASADASSSEKKGDEEFIDDRYFEQEAE